MQQAEAHNLTIETKRASLYTLGCRLNQAETAILEDRLQGARHARTSIARGHDHRELGLHTPDARSGLPLRASRPPRDFFSARSASQGS